MTRITQRNIGRLLLCSCLVLASATLVAANELWIHVYVQDGGEDGETVRVNVPFSLVQAVLPLIQNEHFRDGKVLLPDEVDLDGVDLHEVWKAVRDTADGDFVTVTGRHENVLVAKRDGLLLVNVDDGDEKVRVRLPLAVLDAMFSSGGSLKEIDVLAALRVLGESYPNQDVVTVDDGSTKVRVWIDDRQEMDL